MRQKKVFKNLVKNILNIINFDFNEICHKTITNNSDRVLQKKVASCDKKYINILNNEDISKHFAHIESKDIYQQNVIKSFIIDRIKFIERALGEESIKNSTFIDIGDSDGIFIRMMNKDGVSANISKTAVLNIRNKGIQVIRCNTEYLPLKNNSVDHVLFFEILEHTQNPVATLNELNRVCNTSIFVSIPHMSKTNIHRYHYDKSVPSFENHIFEFDDYDFRKIISHAKLKVKYFEIAEILDKGTFYERCVFFIVWFYRFFCKSKEYADNKNDLFYGCFKKFNIYCLVKEKGQ